jgi:cysteine desulfurase/selenocysteine lyase
MAHDAGALAMVDGAQAGPHTFVDVQDLDADFYTLSCHKIYAPTGVGVLYGKQALLEAMPPYHGGGDMIRTVSFERTTYADLPAKFEAGTPNVAGVIGLGAAIDYVRGIARGTAQLEEIPGIRITGTAKDKAGIVALTLEGAHPHDIGTILDQDGIAIRAGHHCCMPLMRRLGVPATARASFAFYNTEEEVDALVASIRKVKEMFA